jgi:hypothetical protein
MVDASKVSALGLGTGEPRRAEGALAGPEGVVAMADTVLDGSGEPLPGRRPLEGTDLEIAYDLLGDDLVLRVNKAGVQVFGVVLENAGKALTPQQLLELKTESSDLVVRIGTRGEAAANVGYRLGRAAGKLLKATRDKMRDR